MTLARVHGSPEMLRYPAAVLALEQELVLEFAARVLLTECPTLRKPKSRQRRGYDRAIGAVR